MKPLVAFGIVALSCPLIAAAPCQTVCQTPAVVATVPTLVAPLSLPLYGAGYVGSPPPATAPADDETRAMLKKTAESNERLANSIERLIALLSGQQPPPAVTPLVVAAPLAAKIDTFAIFSAKCISCHGKDKQEGDFSLIGADGKKRLLSGPERKSVVRHIKIDMPPKDKPQLTAAEKAQIETDLTDSPK